jgi:uncharacterized protein
MLHENEIPLFPLPLVLNPSGRLSLRIFEPRYLDMVRECSRNSAPFGICARIEQNGRPSVCAIGTEARIVDFNMLPDGLLGIEVEGGMRFHVDSVRTRDNGLSIATVRRVEPEYAAPVPAEYGLLAELVASFYTAAKQSRPLAQELLDDSRWVSFRLAEILPLELVERQTLLEMGEANRRLATLLEWLPRFRKDDDGDAE